jgi:hypothetical protein
MRRTSCLHCVLARVLRAEEAHLAARGLTVTVAPGDPVRLPIAAPPLYRTLRAMLRNAADAAERPPLRVAVLDLPGRRLVEVTATARVGRGARIWRTTLPRHAPGTLEGGFAEGLWCDA